MAKKESTRVIRMTTQTAGMGQSQVIIAGGEAPTESVATRIIEKLNTHINDGDIAAITATLKQGFITEVRHDTIVDTVRGVDHNVPPQGDVAYKYTFTERPVIEELLLNHVDSFFVLVNNAQQRDKRHISETKNALLQAFQFINLAEDEIIHFNRSNLTGASFANANLGQSDFSSATTVDVDFTNCNLVGANITQDQLESGQNHTKAHYWREWSRNDRIVLAGKLQELALYTTRHMTNTDPKYLRARNICHVFTPLLNGNDDLSCADKKRLLNALTSKESHTVFGKHRNYNFLIGEILSFIATLGVGYLIGAAINKYRTGHFGLFAQPSSHKLARDIAQTLTQPSYSNNIKVP